MRILAFALLLAGTTPLLPQAPARAATTITGAVRPGMRQADVIAAWGQPSGTRARGDFTYLFYANQCRPACGTQDVVILERGQVVDAIARAANHRYDGVSSSPAGRAPGFTPAAPARPTPNPSPQR